MGKKYADAIHAGSIVWEDDVPVRRRLDAYDSYVAQGYQPEIHPPEV